MAGVMVLTVVGCGGGGGSQGGGGEGGGELTIAFGPDDTNTLQDVLDRFNEQNEGGYRVNWRKAPADTGQFFDQLNNQLQAGADSPQAFGGDVIWPPQFGANGYVADLTEQFTDQDAFVPGNLESVTFDGAVYAIPWYSDAGLLYYRTDLLEKAGFSEPPKTWDELKEQTKKIQQDNKLRFGYVFQGAQYEGGVCNALEFIRTHGGDVLDPNDATKAIADSPEAAAGLATWRSMIVDGVSPQSVTTYKEDESQAPFLAGDAVFLRNWPYVNSLVGSADFPGLERGQVGIAPLPTDGSNTTASTLGGWTMMINANAGDQEAAYALAQFITSAEEQKFRAIEGSYVPTRQDLLADPEVTEALAVLEQAPEAFENVRARPVTPVYSDVTLAMQEQFSAALKGDVPPEEALGTLQEDVQSIIEQA
jgi:multiple sugar transport system substrate-binding protein